MAGVTKEGSYQKIIRGKYKITFLLVVWEMAELADHSQKVKTNNVLIKGLEKKTI